MTDGKEAEWKYLRDFVAGLVASVPGSVINPVVDAAFALLRNVFGAGNGVSARSAIGVNEPPGGIAVEIALIFQI